MLQSRNFSLVLRCTLGGVAWHIGFPKTQGCGFFAYNVFFTSICHELLSCLFSQTALKVHCRLEFNVKLVTKYIPSQSLACLNANVA